MLHNTKESSRHQYFVKTRQDDVPIHPMQALSRCHQCVRWIECHILDSPMEPAQMSVVTMRQTFALLDHMLRKVYRIQSLNMFDEIACDITGATTSIENMSRLTADESCEKSKDRSRVGRAIPIGSHHTEIFKLFSIFGRKVFWFLKHLCQTLLMRFDHMSALLPFDRYFQRTAEVFSAGSLLSASLQRCPKSLSHSLALPFLCREIAAVLKPAMCVLGGHGEQRLGDRFFQGLSRASLAAS